MIYSETVGVLKDTTALILNVDYMLCDGRNPCLKPDQPEFRVEGWYLKVLLEEESFS